ncbi:cytochrome [Sesamum alatum]|uniref:Cytochrome n=1 Tax=Sesamum alatum TaxID=300844 RepID=A0AAE1XRN6_9LAMI|nr:cytochrome [Sesamum alatum]
MGATLLYTIVALFFIFLIFKYWSREKYHLPPSPSLPLPVFGHLHLLKQPLHRTFRRFSQTHGPIFSLKLGVRRVVVVSSPDLVEECFTINDVVFSNRPWFLVDKYVGYDHTTVAFAPYGHQWRGLRRLVAQEVLSPTRINSFSRIRQDQVRQTMRNLISGNESGKLELRPKLFELIFNIIMRMLAGKRYGGEEQENKQLGEQFREMVREVFEHAQSSNPEDFLPFLLWIDYRGLKKKMVDLGKKLDDFYQGLLEEHRREKRDTIIGHLLSLQESEPEFYTDQIIKGFITCATKTGVASLDNLKNDCCGRGKGAEFEGDGGQVVESDGRDSGGDVVDVGGEGRSWCWKRWDNEDFRRARRQRDTFRLIPAGPLVVPRESYADCRVRGYDIPHGMILLVNAWAIHTDPEVWKEGAPGGWFGATDGGVGFGIVDSVFLEWERVGLEEVDLAEGVGLTMLKLKPLEAMCRPRQDMLNVLQESLNFSS